MNVMYKLQDSNYFAHPVDCELLLVQNDNEKTLSIRYPASVRNAMGVDHTFLPTHSGMMILGCCAMGVQLQKYSTTQQKYCKIVLCGKYGKIVLVLVF